MIKILENFAEPTLSKKSNKNMQKKGLNFGLSNP